MQLGSSARMSGARSTALGVLLASVGRSIRATAWCAHVGLVLIAVAGCTISIETSTGSGRAASAGRSAAQPGRVTMAELDQLTKGYADRYLTLVAAGADEIGRDNPSAEQRRAALLLKLVGVTNVYDIVTNADPFTQLLDLVVAVTLQSQVWIDYGLADEYFGDRAMLIIGPLRRAREDVWEIAARVMTPEQMEVMDRLIWDWHRENPEVQYVSFVRFDSFGSSRGKSIIADIKTGSGLLAPVDQATKAVDEVRFLAERAFFMSKRAPILLSWQTESLFANLMLKPEVARTLDGLGAMSESVHRVTRLVEALPDRMSIDRTALLQGLQDYQKMMEDAVKGYRTAIADTRDTLTLLGVVAKDSERVAPQLRDVALALTQTLTTAEAFLTRTNSSLAASLETLPVADVAEITAELTRALTQLNVAIGASDKLLDSPAWPRRIGELNAAAVGGIDHAARQGTVLVDAIFWRVIVAAAIIIAMLAVYRTYAVWLGRRTATRSSSG